MKFFLLGIQIVPGLLVVSLAHQWVWYLEEEGLEVLLILEPFKHSLKQVSEYREPAFELWVIPCGNFICTCTSIEKVSFLCKMISMIRFYHFC